MKVKNNTIKGPIETESKDSFGYIRPLMPNWLNNSDPQEKSMP